MGGFCLFLALLCCGGVRSHQEDALRGPRPSVAEGTMGSVTEVSMNSVLEDRMFYLQHLVMEQNANLRSLLAYQSEKLEAQDTLLQIHDSLHKDLLMQIQIQQAKLDFLEKMLLQNQDTAKLQENQLRRQRDKQEDVLRQHEYRIDIQERLLTQQEKVIRSFQNVSCVCGKGVHGRDGVFTPRNPDDFVSTPLSMIDNKMGDSVPHHVEVMPRSDDNGPLETVVSQLSQKVTEMSADIQSLKITDIQQNQDITDAKGSTFIQWGNSQCGGSSQLVYSGVVGGSDYRQTGAATNYLCLTLSPVPGTSTPQTTSASLYGGEYHLTGPHYLQDALCAVCRSTYSTTVMIPGTNVCTSGWQPQYSGLLMAGSFDHPSGSEFICVDSDLQSRIASEAGTLGKLLYPTNTRCGTLPCSPYVNNTVVTCVVCSK